MIRAVTFLFFVLGSCIGIVRSKPNNGTCEPTQTFSLVAARVGATAVAIPNRVLFAGGSPSLGGVKLLNAVVIYNLTSKKNRVVHLSASRTSMASTAVGAKAFFGGGGTTQNTDSAVVDVYDGTTNAWGPVLSLSVPRQGLAATSVGTKAIFAGGSSHNSAFAGADIFDTTTNKWVSVGDPALSAPRWGLAAASTDDFAFFGGGQGNDFPSSVVDIYNNSAGKWETAENLSVPRSNLAAAAAGNKVFFAGGRYWNTTNPQNIVLVDTVDIFDVDTRKWTTTHLSEPRELLVGVSWGNWVAFAGGYMLPPDDGTGKVRPQPSATIDAYNVKNGKHITAEMSQARVFLSGVALNNYFFFGFGVGDDHKSSKTVDLFHTLCND